MSRMNVSLRGLDKVMRDFTAKGIKAQFRADEVTEKHTRKMANQAAANAPVKSGDMRANIAASPFRIKRGTWQFGGTLAYTRRQEYEHATQKGFIRRAVWGGREEYRKELRNEVIK